MESNGPYDQLHKIILIGDSGVGKSSIISRYTDDQFSLFLLNTVGVDFKSKTIVLNNMKIRQQIWDTSGQERYKAITRNYFREADGIVLVFDVTDLNSFTKVMDWLEEALTHIDPEKCQKVLIGNKTDLDSSRVISYDQAENMALSLGMVYFETSAKESAHDIQKAFQELSKMIIEFKLMKHSRSFRNRERVDLRNNKKDPKKKCPC